MRLGLRVVARCLLSGACAVWFGVLASHAYAQDDGESQEEDGPEAPPPEPSGPSHLRSVDVCPFAPFANDGAIALCWRIPAAPAAARFRPLASDPRFEIATQSSPSSRGGRIDSQVPSATLVGRTGRCIVRLADTVFVRPVAATPNTPAERPAMQGYLLRGASCEAAGPPMLLLGGVHPDARFVAPAETGQATGARDTRHFLRAHGARAPTGLGALVAASHARADVGRFRFELLRIELATGVVWTLGRNRAPFLTVRDVLDAHGFVSDVSRVFVLIDVRTHPDVPISVESPRVRNVLQIDGDAAALRARGCEKTPDGLTAPECGIVYDEAVRTTSGAAASPAAAR